MGISLRLAPIVLAVFLLAAIPIAHAVGRTSTSSSSPAGTGSGVAATQARSLAPFTDVDLTDENDVVHVGARQSVIVHGDTNLLRRVTRRVDSDTSFRPEASLARLNEHPSSRGLRSCGVGCRKRGSLGAVGRAWRAFRDSRRQLRDARAGHGCNAAGSAC